MFHAAQKKNRMSACVCVCRGVCVCVCVCVWVCVCVCVCVCDGQDPTRRFVCACVCVFFFLPARSATEAKRLDNDQQRGEGLRACPLCLPVSQGENVTIDQCCRRDALPLVRYDLCYSVA